MKKLLRITVASLLIAALAACSNGSKPNENKPEGFDTTKEITVVSREEGSGTRGAFIELLKIEEKQSDGSKVDHTTKEAVIANKTDVVLTNVANDEYAIGYISLGSLNSSVKAVKVDGVEATTANIKNGSYKVSRPFNIAMNGEGSELAKDFIAFIMSAQGQEVVAKSYIKVDDAAPAYAGTAVSGKLVIAGSSSVTPIMEKLVEAYAGVNPNADIEIQMSDSSAGMKAAIDKTADIGMASRELKAEELAVLQAKAIALDGIAIVVNNKNTVSDLSSEQIKGIYTGELTTWADIK